MYAGSNQEEWLPVLLKYIDKEQIPRQYGGTAPDPVGAEAINSMNPPEEPEDQQQGERDSDDETVERLLHSSDGYSEKTKRAANTSSYSCSSTVSSQSTQTDDFNLDHMIPQEEEPGVFGGVLKKIASFHW